MDIQEELKNTIRQPQAGKMPNEPEEALFELSAGSAERIYALLNRKVDLSDY